VSARGAGGGAGGGGGGTSPSPSAPASPTDGGGSFLAAAFSSAGDPLSWVILSAVEVIAMPEGALEWESIAALRAAAAAGDALGGAASAGATSLVDATARGLVLALTDPLSATSMSSGAAAPFAATVLPLAAPVSPLPPLLSGGGAAASLVLRLTRGDAANAASPEWRVRDVSGASPSPRWWL
jgi:hypothetical protein